MTTVTGLEKKLNRVSRQVKGIIQLIVLVIVLFGIVQTLYTSFQEEKGFETVPVASPQPAATPSPEVLGTEHSDLETAIVSRVVDGDTIRLGDGRAVRYIGVNTPETVAPNRPVECFGKEASAYNKQLVEGKSVWLEKDVSETDRYGRLLRYVYLEPVASLSAQVNFLLVEQGYAQASSYPPDIKWQETLQDATERARENQRGLWSACLTEKNSL